MRGFFRAFSSSEPRTPTVGLGTSPGPPSADGPQPAVDTSGSRITSVTGGGAESTPSGSISTAASTVKASLTPLSKSESSAFSSRGKGTHPMTLTGGGSMFELRRGLSATSLDGGGEEEDGEETEAEEDLLPCFNPRKAHEVFIWMALNGASPEQLASNAMELSGSRKLKWADEDGGVLHNIQYFDKDAEPSTVLRSMLAADARAEGAPGSGKAAQGREEIVKNMRPILAQIHGNVQEVSPIKLMKNGETRTVLVAGRGPFRTTVGVAITWMGGLIQHLVMIKNPDVDFMEESSTEPDVPPSSTSSDRGSPEGGVDPSPRSCESDIFVLSPPYLVPRPAVFPVPTLTVCVISAHNLKSSAKLPRPINPYVKLKLGGIEQRTPVLTNTKNPVWGGMDDTCRFCFSAGDPNAILHVTVGDWKIGQNLWIARLVIPLASIEVNMAAEGAVQDFQLRCRTSRFTKHIESEGTSTAKLVLRLKYENMERWWTLQELKARDEARQSREAAEQEERAAEELAAVVERKAASSEPCCIQ